MTTLPSSDDVYLAVGSTLAPRFLVDQLLDCITEAARTRTRGHGFHGNRCEASIRQVVLDATCRSLAHGESQGPARAVFHGFSLAEQKVLDSRRVTTR